MIRPLVLAAASLLLAPAALAIGASVTTPGVQDRASSEEPERPALVVTEAERERLDARNRAELHPAEDPLVVTGIDAGDPDLRARTPALARAEIRPVAVDAEELRRRRIAMYEQGSRFDAPARPEPRTDDGAPTEAPERREAEAPRGTEPKGGISQWIWLGLITCGAALLAIVKRGR